MASDAVGAGSVVVDEPIKGYAGYADPDSGRVVVVSGERALELATRYEPFPVYRKVTDAEHHKNEAG